MTWVNDPNPALLVLIVAMLAPVATVIIGGLISSTAMEFFVRPALFWSFGIAAAKRAVRREEDPLESTDLGE